MNDLGKRLISLRLQKDLSISEVAKKLEVSPSTYREWEQGRQIQGEPYQKLALLFEVSLTELLTGQRPAIDTYMKQIEDAVKSIRSLL
jgi:transcriptional regulator with XRE-family HTH domain